MISRQLTARSWQHTPAALGHYAPLSFIVIGSLCRKRTGSPANSFSVIGDHYCFNLMAA